MPLKDMSLPRAPVPCKSGATRVAKMMTAVIQMVVEMDSMTSMAREDLLRWNFRGHIVAERIHWRRLMISLRGMTLKPQTQIILGCHHYSDSIAVKEVKEVREKVRGWEDNQCIP